MPNESSKVDEGLEHAREIDDMTRSLLERILYHSIDALRKAAMTGNDHIVSTARAIRYET